MKPSPSSPPLADDAPGLVTMPFTRGRVLLPAQDRASARVGMALASASRPRVVRTHAALERAVAAFGPRLLPRSAHSLWPAWLGHERWSALQSALADTAGPFDAVAVRHPLSSELRRVLLLLVRSGEAVGFVKVRADQPSVEAEAVALRRVAGTSDGGLRVPRLLGQGSTDGLHWLVTEALPPGCHTPAAEPGPTLEGWLDTHLRNLLPPADVPEHWRPIHGDLTPWNLRRSGPTTWLLDWEAVGWGPPSADRAYFRATSAVVLGSPPGRAPAETVAFWADRVRVRTGVDRMLNARLLDVLASMGPGGAPG